MKTVRTEAQLQDFLDKEFSWRLKEISDMKLLVKSGQKIRTVSAVRAGIPILYAHWEGFIKNAATCYVEYINNLRLPYSELKSCFVVLGVKRHIETLVDSKNASDLIGTLEFVRNGMEEQAKLKIESAVRTEFNLSSKVFSNICTTIGLGMQWYEPRYNLIDTSLLKRRNSIAHGEYLDVEIEGFWSLANEVVLLLRAFKTDIENAVALKAYKIAA